MKAIGMRGVKVFKNVTSGKLHGNYIYAEVTNDGETDVEFFVNDFTEDGQPATEGIPIAKKSTRIVPMYISNFSATGSVTVVVYMR